MENLLLLLAGVTIGYAARDRITALVDGEPATVLPEIRPGSTEQGGSNGNST